MKINLTVTQFLLGLAVIVIIFLLFRSCDGNSITDINKKYDPTLHFDPKDSTTSKQLMYLSKNLNDLKFLNDSLFKQLKTIKGTKTEVHTIKMIYKTDTLRLPNNIIYYGDHSYGAEFEYHTAYQDLKGVNHFTVTKKDTGFVVNKGYTLITDNDYRVSLITGLRKVKGGEEIYIKSADSSLKIVDIQGYKIQRKPKHWSVGPTLGYGINSNGTITTNISIGIQYSLFKF